MLFSKLFLPIEKVFIISFNYVIYVDIITTQLFDWISRFFQPFISAKSINIRWIRTGTQPFYIQLSTNIKLFLIISMYILHPRKDVYNTMQEKTLTLFEKFSSRIISRYSKTLILVSQSIFKQKSVKVYWGNLPGI